MSAVMAKAIGIQEAQRPVVVVGTGPVGVRVAQELRRRLPGSPLVVFGAEPWQPYNRVRLSSFIAGELNWNGVSDGIRLPDDALSRAELGYRIVSIDRDAGLVTDATGRVQAYSSLVIATGSRPHIPDIPGITLPGVYTFRNMNDAHRLMARSARSRRTVVLGGGLLGLESAWAMRRFRTEVCVVEHADRLMPRQLDEGAGEVLRAWVEDARVRVLLGTGVREIMGETAVEGVQLGSGEFIACDTVIVATGIRPNVELAFEAGLVVGRGIKVDDTMQTSDPRIYAVGECAEHRGEVYGIVAPGFEQAAVAAHAIAGGSAHYAGSVAATRLKVVGCPVFSMGEIGAMRPVPRGRGFEFRESGGYRKLMLRGGRLQGAVAVGGWSQLSRVQESLQKNRRIWPWEIWRFRRTGLLWPEQTMDSVVQWPASATVCNCVGVTRGVLGSAMAEGCASAAQLAARTGASTVCGSCRPLLQELIGGSESVEPVRWSGPLAISAAMALVLAITLTLTAIPFPDTSELLWRWDQLWRDSFWKQVSGFTLLGVMAALALVSLRKRLPRLPLGDFAGWRLAHAFLGVVALLALLVHSGGRMGDGLNLWLAAAVMGLVLAGAVAGGVIAGEHRLSVQNARRLREGMVWVHILLLWPLPILLAFHILKSYWY